VIGYAKKIEDSIRDIVGPVFAKSSVMMACKKAGLDIEVINEDDLASIADNMKGALSVGFGGSVADTVAQKIKSL
jgi:leucyl aminopeptidase